MATTMKTHRQRLAQLSIGELRLEYEKVCGELTTSRHAKHIIKRILWQMQANLLLLRRSVCVVLAVRRP